MNPFWLILFKRVETNHQLVMISLVICCHGSSLQGHTLQVSIFSCSMRLPWVAAGGDLVSKKIPWELEIHRPTSWNPLKMIASSLKVVKGAMYQKRRVIIRSLLRKCGDTAQDWMEHRARGSCHLDVLPDRSTMHVRQWAEHTEPAGRKAIKNNLAT